MAIVVSKEEELEQKTAQRESSKSQVKRASYDLLKSKRRAQQEFTLKVDDGDGEIEASFLFRAVGAKEWDALVTNHQPNKDQRAEGMSYNPDTFGPALLSRVCIDPVMTETDWSELWNSKDWSKGELSELFWSAVGLCNRGLDVNPIEPVSE